MLTNKDVAIFGVNWPEVDGVAYIYQCIEQGYNIETYYSLADLFKILQCSPNKECILIIQPHNNAYFLYTLSQSFWWANIKIVTDTLYLSDRVILSALGFSDATTFGTLINAKKLSFSSAGISRFPSLDDFDKREFLIFINKVIINRLKEWGITEMQKKVLSYVVKGESNYTIGRRLKISDKTVSSHKIEALKKLPHGRDRFAITKGLRAQS